MNKRWPFMQIDIETLSVSNRAAIIQIAARPFSIDEVCEEHFEVVVNADVGVVETRTVSWWEEQPNVPDYKNGVPTVTALEQLAEFFSKHCGKEVKLWCQGANFDASILEAHYARAQIKAPWEFWNVCCNRTLGHIVRYLPVKTPAFNTKSNHNAIDDVDRQIRNVQRVLAALADALEPQTTNTLEEKPSSQRL